MGLNQEIRKELIGELSDTISDILQQKEPDQDEFPDHWSAYLHRRDQLVTDLVDRLQEIFAFDAAVAEWKEELRCV